MFSGQRELSIAGVRFAHSEHIGRTNLLSNNRGVSGPETSALTASGRTVSVGSSRPGQLNTLTNVPVNPADMIDLFCTLATANPSFALAILGTQGRL